VHVYENTNDNAARDPVSARDAFFRDSVAVGAFAFVEIEQVANWTPVCPVRDGLSNSTVMQVCVAR